MLAPVRQSPTWNCESGSWPVVGVALPLGDGDVEVHRVRGIEDSGPGDLTFVANPRYVPRLAATRAGAVTAAIGSTLLRSHGIIRPMQ